MYNGSFSKQNNPLGKKISTTVESRIPTYPPNYTKNRKVRDLPNTVDPKDEIPTIEIQILRP